MGTIGDITELLAKIPLWKRLSTLPKEVEELRERVAVLEGKLVAPSGAQCPKCGARTFVMTASAPHPQFGFAGMKVDSYSCSSCGFAETRTRETRT